MEIKHFKSLHGFKLFVTGFGHLGNPHIHHKLLLKVIFCHRTQISKSLRTHWDPEERRDDISVCTHKDVTLEWQGEEQDHLVPADASQGQKSPAKYSVL